MTKATNVTNETKATKGEAGEVSFEDAIARLSAIVEQLERGDLPLGDSVKLFEEGVSLVRRSQAELDTAERRIEELLAVDASGAPRTEPFG